MSAGVRHGPGRVVRGVDDEEARLWRDRRAHGVPSRCCSRDTCSGTNDRDAAAQLDRRDVRVVARLEDDGLVARVKHGGDGIEDGFGPAGGDRHFCFRVVPAAVKLLVLGRDRLAQRQDPLHRRVLVSSRPHVARDSLHQLRVAIEVGKPLREVDCAEIRRRAATSP